MDKKVIKKNSIAIGIMLSSGVLSNLLFFLPKGIMFLIIIPFVYLLCINKSSFWIKNDSNVISFLILLFLFCFESLVLSGFEYVTVKYVGEFLCLGVPFILVSKYPIDAISMFRTIVVLGTIVIPSQLMGINIEFMSYADDGEFLMQISYSLLKASIASVLLLAFDKSVKFKLIALFNIGFSSLFLFTVGSRGAMLSFVFAIVFVILYYNNKRIHIVSLKMFLMLMLGIFLLFNIVYVFEFVASFLYFQDIKSIGVERIIDDIGNAKNISTGRDLIFEKALQGFYDSPFWGNGIGSFDNYSGKYTHNIITQSLYEGGLLFGAPIIFIVMYSLSVLNSNINREFRWVYIYLVSACLIQLMLSSYFWCSSILWFMLGLSLRKLRYKIKLFSCYYSK